jgi:uncharacterized membrane protein
VPEEITPATVMTTFWRWAGVIILGIALAGVLTWAGWQAGWWLTTQNNARQAHLIRNGYANQQSLREQLTQQIANVATETTQIAAVAGDMSEVQALSAQRAATVNIACQAASEITGDPLPAQQSGWVASNCFAGSLRPGSQYDTTGETP